MKIIHCEHCGACKRACPTGILRGEGVDCLSAITQKKGTLEDSEKEELIRLLDKILDNDTKGNGEITENQQALPKLKIIGEGMSCGPNGCNFR